MLEVSLSTNKLQMVPVSELKCLNNLKSDIFENFLDYLKDVDLIENFNTIQYLLPRLTKNQKLWL